MPSSVWVTGARGFIGRHLARRNAELGHIVSGIGHGAWTAADASAWGVAYWLNGEISSSNLDGLASRTGIPETIYHLAGGSVVGLSFENPFEDFARTAVTTACLLDWLRLRSRETRLVTVSSAAVYGAGHELSIPESAPLAPMSPYGTHKAAMEWMCQSYARNYGLNIAVIRLFSVYGPELRKQLLWEICVRVRLPGSELTLQGTGQELRDWIDVSDAVTLLRAAANWAGPDCVTVNGGTGIGTPVREIAALLVAALGSDKQLVFTGVRRTGDPDRLVADTARMSARGFAPEISLASGIRRYADWYRTLTGT